MQSKAINWNKKGDIFMRFTAHAPTFIVYAKNLNELIILNLNSFPVKLVQKVSFQSQVFDIDTDPLSKSQILLCHQKCLALQRIKHQDASNRFFEIDIAQLLQSPDSKPALTEQQQNQLAFVQQKIESQDVYYDQEEDESKIQEESSVNEKSNTSTVQNDIQEEEQTDVKKSSSSENNFYKLGRFLRNCSDKSRRRVLVCQESYVLLLELQLQEHQIVAEQVLEVFDISKYNGDIKPLQPIQITFDASVSRVVVNLDKKVLMFFNLAASEKDSAVSLVPLSHEYQVTALC